MAKVEGSVKVRLADLERTKLFIYQLNELRSQMVVEANPRASDLEKIINRYVKGGDDDRRSAIT